MVGLIRVTMWACNKFFGEQGSHPRLSFLLLLEGSFPSIERELLLLKDSQGGIRRLPHVSTRSGSTRQKASRFIEADLLLLLPRSLFFQQRSFLSSLKEF